MGKSKPFSVNDDDWMEFLDRLEATTYQFGSDKGMTFTETSDAIRTLACLWFRIQMVMNDTCVLIKYIKDSNAEEVAPNADAIATRGHEILRRTAAKFDEIMNKARADQYKALDEPIREFRLFLENLQNSPN